MAGDNNEHSLSLTPADESVADVQRLLAASVFRWLEGVVTTIGNTFSRLFSPWCLCTGQPAYPSLFIRLASAGEAFLRCIVVKVFVR